MRKRTGARDYRAEHAVPVETAQLAENAARLNLAAAADPIPALPPAARKAEAIAFASCALAFAALTTWISRPGHAVPAADGVEGLAAGLSNRIFRL